MSKEGWRVEGLPVQGYSLPGLGPITFEANWHGNHRAFPHSVKLPEDVPPRAGLVRVPSRAAPVEGT